jgi:hypothetical protein
MMPKNLSSLSLSNLPPGFTEEEEVHRSLLLEA